MKSMKTQIKEAAYIVLGLGLLAIAVSALQGCGQSAWYTGPAGPQGEVGASGSQGSVGATGSQGDTGAAGAQGLQGYGAGLTTTQLPIGNPNCTNGGVELVDFQDLNNSGVQLPDDPILALTYVCNGTDGAQGMAGTNGTSTTFSVVTDNGMNCANGGYDITFTDASGSQTEYLCNGVNGASGAAGLDGTNGANGGTVTFDLVQAIEPCGAASSPWKEVLLGLQGGQILSAFSETESGQDTRLSFIPNGTYEDTDESGCNFTVSGDGLTWSSISWAAGSNQYSTWVAGGFSWAANTGWVAQ